MTEERKFKGGVMFTVRNKKSDKSPDWSGELILDRELVIELANLVNAGQDAKIALTAYDSEHPKAGKYLKVYGKKFVEWKTKKTDDKAPF
jgi:hypothetical protein